MSRKISITFGILVVLIISIFIFLFSKASLVGTSERDLKDAPEIKNEEIRDGVASSLKLDESHAGVQEKGDGANTSDWLVEKNDVVDFSFLYPQNAKIINEGNCYRVEYELGFVIFFLPVEGDMRCGARTGVGVLPNNVDVTDYFTINGEEYVAPGFNAVMDTKAEEFSNPEKRYSYDFYHMFDLNKDKNCENAKECGRVGYGIYKEVSTPLNKEDIDNTMNILQTIIESVNFEKNLTK